MGMGITFMIRAAAVPRHVSLSSAGKWFNLCSVSTYEKAAHV